MTYDLFVGDVAYSSWSLRGWLAIEAFGLRARLHHVPIVTPGKMAALAELAPAETVPVLRLPEGTIVGDSLAIAETLAERHPGAGHWPSDAGHRATARWLAAEMHSGFAALRTACPMCLARRYEGFRPSEAVLDDLRRIEALWAHAWRLSGGPWLLGRYSLADVFFAPVAVRIAGYRLPVGDDAQAYVARHLAHPPLVGWHRMAADPPDAYPVELPWTPWQPGDPAH